MRNYFILNGVDSRDFGVYISGQGTFGAPQKAYTYYNVPGRNGAILGNEHRLENVEVTYEAFIYSDFDKNIAAFRTFLLSLNGYVKLSDSYHPDEYRYAVYEGPFEPEVTSKNDAGSFTIIFSCKPQRYLISGDTKFTWYANGAQYSTGSEVAVYAPRIDQSVFEYDAAQHGIVVRTSPSRTYSLAEISSASIQVKDSNDNVIASKTYNLSSYNATEIHANLVSGSLSIKASIVPYPTTGWSDYTGNGFKFRTAVSNWSGINANVTDNRQAPRYTRVDSVADLTNVIDGICYESGYLYVKDHSIENVSDFVASISDNYHKIDRTMTTPTTISIEPFTYVADSGYVTISSNQGENGSFKLKYTEDDTMANPTAFPSSPLLRAYGNGSFTMDGITVTITNATDYTDIDCDIMDCYEGTTNRNNDVSFSSYNFPQLQPGDNQIDIVSGITVLEITPRWWRV